MQTNVDATGGSVDAASMLELTILMPCLNEAETLARCIGKAQSYLSRSGVRGEIVIADNGSSDGSQEIAFANGARVVTVAEKGYGSALLGGIAAARGRLVIMGDADDSYDFSELDPFVEALRAGADIVMGNRFRGGIEPGAMPIHHRYLGNPVLSALGRLLFPSRSRDFHCGLRGFSKNAINSLHLQTTGMEFASEMVVKGSLHGLDIVEVPTTLARDGRNRPPHLRSWRDGWRHLRFLLIYSPTWLFLFPGIALAAIGAATMVALIPGPLPIGRFIFDTNTLIYAGLAILLGLQCVMFSWFTRVFGVNAGLFPTDERFERRIAAVSLERGLIVGGVLILVGIIGSIWALGAWRASAFGPLNVSSVSRITVPSLVAIAAGVQIVFGSFFISILQIGKKPGKPYVKRSR